MQFNEFTHSGVATGGPGYNSTAQSLRLRRLSSRVPNPNATPHFDWGNDSEWGDYEETEEEPRNLRELPMPYSMRRAVRQVQQMRVPVASGRVRRSRALKRFYTETKNAMDMVTLWRRVIQKIGGHFGGGVQSYFVFLRFLVILNFLSSFLIAGFVLIPAIVFNSLNTTTIPPSERNITGREACMAYDPDSGALTVFYTYFLDLLSGTGFMEYSYMFYGYYNNTVGGDNGYTYNIPLAYLLTASFYFIFCLISIIIRMGGVMRLAVTTGGGAAGGYSMMVFTGWDYGLQGDRATELKRKNIRYQLQVDLEEDRIRLKAQSLTLLQTVGQYALRTLANLIVLALIGGAFAGIFYATRFSQGLAGTDGIVGLLIQYLPSIVITASNFVVPFLCDQIARLEKHSPSTTIILALLRAVFLRLVSLAVLLFTLWRNIVCSDTEDSACKPCKYNHNQYPCWETRVGQEMYKLTLFDFLTTIAVLILVEFPRRMLVDHSSWSLVQWMGRQEFEVPPNVLGLVYSQTVVWTGALFCPLLPMINTIKFVIIFYCKKITLFHNCRPAVKTFRSTTSNVVFFVVLLFGWSLASVALVYSMAEIDPSYGCGPFRLSTTMWSIVPTSFNSLSNTTQEFLSYAGSQAFSVPLFLFSIVTLFYVAALTSVYGKSVALLKTQIHLEGLDKQFLVKQVEELNKKLGGSEQHRDPNARRPIPKDFTRDTRNPIPEDLFSRDTRNPIPSHSQNDYYGSSAPQHPYNMH